ncbi:hypothetical protein LTS18_009740, partial [Coniosporium uncinatum]
MYSVYHAAYAESKPASSLFRQRRAPANEAKNRRRSSFIPGTGATTPAARPRESLRESFGGAMRAGGASFATNQRQRHDTNDLQSAEDALTSQLDPDFEKQRQPARESRRVSSLLSRTDFATSHDRTAFQDLATSHTGTAAHVRRGQSLGGANERLSMTNGSRARYRASTPASVSQLSFDGVTVEDFGDDPESSDPRGPGVLPYRDIQNFGFLDPLDGLKQELILQKWTEIPMDHPGTFSSWTAKTEAKERPKVFTLVSPRSMSATGPFARRFCVHIVNKSTSQHVELCYNMQRLEPGKSAPRTDPVSLNILIPHMIGIQRYETHVDALPIRDGLFAAVAFLRRSGPADTQLHIHTCWKDELEHVLQLPQLRVFNPYFLLDDVPSSSPRSTGRRRTLGTPKSVTGLAFSGFDGCFDLIEQDQTRHQLLVQLQPRNNHVARILEVCRFALPNFDGEQLLSRWWQVVKLAERAGRLLPEHLEWLALIAAIFTLGPPRDQTQANVADSSDVRKLNKYEHDVALNTFLASGAWNKMWSYELQATSMKSYNSSPWEWSKISDTHSGVPLLRAAEGSKDFNSVIQDALRLAAGIQQNAGEQKRHPAHLPRLLVALHLMREEDKLNIVSATDEALDLAPALAQLGRWIGWEEWGFRTG